MIRLLLLLYCAVAGARELFPGQYANVDQVTQEWFRSQKVPNTNFICCNEADGVFAEEEIRGGSYWTRFRPHGKPPTGWMKVPPDVIIQGPNRNPSAVVWYFFDNEGIVYIRCYARGPLI